MDDLTDFVARAYDRARPPLYLAQLGLMLKEGGFDVANLKNTIERMDGFCVIQGRERERLAVAKEADRFRVQGLLDAVPTKRDCSAAAALKCLPRNLLYAFCSKGKYGGGLYIQPSAPFHYAQTREQEGMLPIPEESMLSLFVPTDLKEMCANDAEELLAAIRAWTVENGLDLDAMTDLTGPSRELSAGVEALRRFISFIPPKRRAEIRLPLDVIVRFLR